VETRTFRTQSGLALIYGLEPVPASELVQPLLVRAHELLQRGLIDNLAASTGVTVEEAEIQLAQARAKRAGAGSELGAGSLRGRDGAPGASGGGSAMSRGPG
jgi:hypothetical protein